MLVMVMGLWCVVKAVESNDTWTLLERGAGNVSEEVQEYNLPELIKRFEMLYPIEEWMAAGYFTRDYLTIVNPHWLRFAPRPKWQHYALAISYMVIMFVGVTGNFLVIYLFARCKALRTPANILVISLACSDLLMMLKMPIFIYNSLHLGPALGDKACRLYGFVGGLSGTCSICTITAISLDRFYVVKYPLKNRFSSQRAKLCVSFSWLYAGSFSIIPLLDIGYGRYVPEGFLTSCSFDYLTDNNSAKSFIWIFSFGAFVLPITLITFFYSSILRVVVQKKPVPGKQRLTGRESQRHMKVEDKRKQELRVTAVVFSVIVVWFLAWTPYAIIALLGICGQNDIIYPLSSMIPALFCKSAACCDPFIYALTHPKFKSELEKLCCRKARVRRTFTARSTYTSTHGDVSHVESSIMADDGPNNVTGTKTKYWWNKPGFNVHSSSLKTLSRGFSQRRRSSSSTIQKAQLCEDGVEVFVLNNLKEREEYM